MSTKEWGTLSSNFNIYMLLPEGLPVSNLNGQLAAFNKKYYKVINDNLRSNFLQPLSEVHFDNRFENFGDHVTTKSVLWTLSLIGVFILLMACVNFINLSTAQAVKRSKEIGVRKVLGSNRKQVFSQVIGETFIIVVISVLVAFGIAELAKPYLSHISSLPDDISFLNIQTIVFLIGLIIIVTLLSGFYHTNNGLPLPTSNTDFLANSVFRFLNTQLSCQCFVNQ